LVVKKSIRKTHTFNKKPFKKPILYIHRVKVLSCNPALIKKRWPGTGIHLDLTRLEFGFSPAKVCVNTPKYQ